MNAPKSWLSFSVAILVLAACSSSNNSTTSGGANGSGASGGSGATGATGATGASNASGTVSGGSGGSAGNGTTTGGQDPLPGKCSQTGNGDYMSCSTTKDCQCPLVCGLDPVLGVDDAGGSICVSQCTQTSECPDIFTHCDAHGLCTINICEADGGNEDGPFMASCNAAGQNDGTCEPEADSHENIIGVCFQSGTSPVDGGCDPTFPAFALANAMNAKRPPAASLCPVGFECGGNGECQQLCDPVFNALSDNDAGGCSEGNCVAYAHDTAFGGACQEQGDGGCLVGNGTGELTTCILDTDCECPFSCKIDSDSFLHLCEQECQSTVPDCDVPYTSCQKPLGAPLGQSYCSLNFCAETYFGIPFKPDGGSHLFGSACNYNTAGDGSCQLQFSADQFGNVINTFGLCVPGTAATGQACGGGTSPPYCNQGDLCAPFQSGALCEPACDPQDAGCPPGDGCFSWIPYSSSASNGPLPQVAGVCLSPCSAAAASCLNSSECCDGFCAFDVDAGTGACN